MSPPVIQDQTVKGARGLTLAHVTDLSDGDLPAFAHAVALAERSASTLVTVHASAREPGPVRMPRAVDLLVRWGKLEVGAVPGDEQRVGMRHQCLVDSEGDDVVDTLLDTLQRVRPQLLVAATSNRDALQRLMLGSVARELALQVRVPTLIIPPTARPFVGIDSGQVRLSRILVAAGDVRAAHAGAAHAIWLADIAGAAALEVELLQVSSAAQTLTAPVSTRALTQVRASRVAGSFEEQFVKRADSWSADLLVVATRGHDSLGDVFMGSHAERVLQRATCPLLSVPLQ